MIGSALATLTKVLPFANFLSSNNEDVSLSIPIVHARVIALSAVTERVSPEKNNIRRYRKSPLMVDTVPVILWIGPILESGPHSGSFNTDLIILTRFDVHTAVDRGRRLRWSLLSPSMWIREQNIVCLAKFLDLPRFCGLCRSNPPQNPS